MNVRGLRPKPGVVAFMQKVGIVAGALIAMVTVLSFVWKRVEAPVYAEAAAIDARHSLAEERIDARIERLAQLVEYHAREDSTLITILRQRMR